MLDFKNFLDSCKKNRLTSQEYAFLLDSCKRNRESSAALAELIKQRWKDEHREEVKRMDRLIQKLEEMQTLIVSDN